MAIIRNAACRTLKVGKRYPDMMTDHAMTELSYDGTWELSMGLPHIMEEELQDYRNGRLQMALADVHGLLFVLYRFGGQPWCDVHFEPRLRPEAMYYPQLSDGMFGVALLANIYDTATGELKARRLACLPKELTNRLHGRCTELDSERPLDPDSHSWKLQQAYRRYRRSIDLLREAGKVYDM